MTADLIDIESSPEPLPSKRAWLRNPNVWFWIVFALTVLWFSQILYPSRLAFSHPALNDVCTALAFAAIPGLVFLQSRLTKNPWFCVGLTLLGLALLIPVLLLILFIFILSNDPEVVAERTYSGVHYRVYEVRAKGAPVRDMVYLHREVEIFPGILWVTPMYSFHRLGKVEFLDRPSGQVRCQVTYTWRQAPEFCDFDPG